MTKIIEANSLIQAGARNAGYTTKLLGSEYEQLAALLQINTDVIQSLKQIHSAKVHELSAPIGQEIIEGDALMTNNPDWLIGVRVADCLPLLVWDPTTGYKAAIHAGWRGLVAGIIENTLRLLSQRGVLLKNCFVSLGPCICDSCFEVGPEVVVEFSKKFGTVDDLVKSGQRDRSFINLKKAAHQILVQEGIAASSITISAGCTACTNDLWPSFRKGDKVLRTFCHIR